MTVQFISHSGAKAGTPNAHELRGATWRLLFDCGASRRGAAYLEKMERPDAVWISHAHGDHCGGILELLERWPKVRVLATATTAKLLRFALAGGRGGASESARVEALIRRIKRVPWRRFVDLPGVTGARIMALPAGHISGAAMAVVEVDDEGGDPGRRRILYAGDFCTHDQAVVEGAGIPTMADGQGIDALICEAMLATDTEADRVVWADEAQRLVEVVRQAEGPVLIGVASIGESVEVASVLGRAGLRPMVDDYLKKLFEICGVDEEGLVFGSRSRMEGRLRADGVVVAPGDQYRRGTAAFQLAGPLVDDPKATLVVLNRARGKTGAGRLLKTDRGDSIKWGARKTKLAARTAYFRLINHAPRWQLQGFIQGVDAATTLLVHGSTGARWALKRSLASDGFEATVEIVEEGELLSI